MKILVWFSLFLCILFSCADVSADTITLTFESLSEGDVLANQFAPLGLIVTGSPVVFSAGSLLNEIDFPPVSGNNVIVDVGGPINFIFTPTSALSVAAYFTYATTLTLQVFTPSGILLETKTSAGSSNLGSN